MASLNRLLQQMDEYDWDSVEDIERNFKPKSIKRTLKELEFNLDGLVLDVACGSIITALLHKDTIGYDMDPKAIKSLRNKGYKGIIGNMVDMPFEDKTFDITISFWPPLRPYNEHLISQTLDDEKGFVEKVIDEMVRVTKKRILIAQPGFVKLAPEKYESLEEFKNGTYLIYSLK